MSCLPDNWSDYWEGYEWDLLEDECFKEPDDIGSDQEAEEILTDWE